MRSKIRWLTRLFLALAIALAAVVVLLVLLNETRNREATSVTATATPDAKDPAYIGTAVSGFLYEASNRLSGGDLYRLEGLKGPVGNWLLLRLSRQNPDWKPGTGAEGEIAIGHLEEGRTWFFQRQSDDLFDTWLQELPDSLLSAKLKESFRPGNQTEGLSSANYPIDYVSMVGYQEPTIYLPFPAGVTREINTLPGAGGSS